MEQSKCPICLDDISNVKVTSCQHRFCSQCIDLWMVNHNSCPCCRQDIRPQNTSQNIGRVQLVNHVVPARVAPTTEEIVRMFPNIQHLVMPNLYGYFVHLSLRGQTNWVPQEWWDLAILEGPRTNSTMRLLDSGVNGEISLRNLSEAPRNLWICDFCTDTQYVSDMFSIVDAHEREQHPLEYVPPNAIIAYDVPY